MGFYARQVLPLMIDCLCGIERAAERRRLVAPRAEGVVLDLGTGSGHNLPLFARDRVTAVIGLDPCATSLAMARGRAERLGLPFRAVEASGERIPLPDESVDSVVVAFTLCTVQDVGATLAEVRRVLRPGGRLHFCAHVAAQTPGLLRWQRRVTPVWAALFGGCRLDRSVPDALVRAGFAIEELQEERLRGEFPLVAWQSVGTAVAA